MRKRLQPRLRYLTLLAAMVGAACLLAFGLPGTAHSTTGVFTCPPTDNSGFPLGPGSNTNIDPIFCSYPAFAGENPNDFFCTYDGTTGALVQDNDAGLCPPNAVQSQPFPTSVATTVMMGGVPVTTVPIGSTVSDHAVVSPSGATGTVRFDVFANGTCSGSPSLTQGPYTLSGGTADSGTLVYSSAITFAYQATYSGDGNHVGSTGPCEPFTVTTLTATQTATTVQMNGSDVTSVPLGSDVTDHAVVTPSGATGTVSFTIYEDGVSGCAGTSMSLGTHTLSSGAASSDDIHLNFVQTFYFQAVYSGDSTHSGSTGPCESVQVTKGPTQTATTVRMNGNTVTSVPAQSTVTDRAVVSGQVGTTTLTGTVSFSVYANGTCSGAPTSAGTTPVSGGVANSNPVGPLPPGTYSFQAVYNGDANYQGSTGPCETFTVEKGITATVTMIGCCGTTIFTAPAGTTFTDQAVVSGQINNITMTGTVTFTFWANSTCTPPRVLTRTGPLSNWTASTGPIGPLAAGSYSFQAVYSGDTNYDGSTSDCERLLVTAGAASTTATTITVGGSGTPVTTAALGSTATDHATVSVPAGGPAPTGTVSFAFYSNGTCSGTGTPAGSSPLATGTSSPQGPLAAGSYSFQAAYSGDTNYSGSTSPCETLTVGKAATAISTKLKLNNNGKAVDQATVSGQVGSIALTGTLSFSMYATGNCTGAATPAGTIALSGGTAKSNGKTPPASGPYSFKAVYSGDSNYNGSTGPCETPT